MIAIVVDPLQHTARRLHPDHVSLVIMLPMKRNVAGNFVSCRVFQRVATICELQRFANALESEIASKLLPVMR